LTNGYDPDDMPKGKEPLANEKFTIVYTGSHYGAHAPSSKAFLDAISQLLQNNQLPSDGFQIQFVGAHSDLISEVTRRGLESQVQLLGYRSHQEAVIYQHKADALLLIILSEAAYSGKIFEYIASGKPIIALAPVQGVAARLVKQTQTGIVVEPQNVSAIAETVLQLYQDWQMKKETISPNWEMISQFNRRMITGKLAGIFSDLVGASQV
jgi:glycosyltransferase involved in cell wall biosynthesis